MLHKGSDNIDHKPQPLALANVAQKLTPYDIALGIGRKATEEEIEEYLDRPHGKSIPLRDAISQIKSQLHRK